MPFLWNLYDTMKTENQRIADSIEESITVKRHIYKDLGRLDAIDSTAEKMIEAYKAGKKTLFAGNGGSAADAQHLTGEFVSRFNFDRPGLPSIALTTDPSIFTAISNDYGFSNLFARQIQALACEGDVFVGISTSGNSENIVNALKACKEKGVYTVGLTGMDGGLMREWCDTCLCVPSYSTPRIQESHILIGHILCELVEDSLFQAFKPVK